MKRLIRDSATFQTTITAFANNGEHNYNFSTYSETIQTGTDGLVTVFRTHLPKDPLSFPACMDPTWYGGVPFTKQWSSVCSCQGVVPVTTTVETVVIYL